MKVNKQDEKEGFSLQTNWRAAFSVSAVYSIKSPSSNRHVPNPWVKAPMGRNLPLFLLFLRYNNIHKMKQESFMP